MMLVYVPAVTTLLALRTDLRRYVMPTLLVSVTVQSLVVIEAVAGGLVWQSGLRIGGAFGSVQLWPYAAAVVAAAALVMTGSVRTRVAVLLALLPIAAAEMFLRSRMLWIASLLGATVFLFAQARSKVAAAALVSICVAALAGGYLLGVYPAAVQVRISDALNPTQTPDLVARLDVLRALSGAVVESPLVGLGIGQSAEYVDRLPAPPPVVNVHNVIVHAAVEGGIAAAAALALLPIAFLLLWRHGTTSSAGTDRVRLNWAFASLLAIYAAAQLTPTLYEHTFYFLIGCLASFGGPTGGTTTPGETSGASAR
jgi:hypothetical protein